MFSQFSNRVFAALLLLVPLALSCFAQNAPGNTDQDIQIEVPADGHIRLDNQFGAVAAEVWKEKYVSVSAVIDGTTTFARSPVVIENRNQLLVIRIVRRPTDPSSAINLAVKVPES